VQAEPAKAVSVEDRRESVQRGDGEDGMARVSEEVSLKGLCAKPMAMPELMEVAEGS
jgi:hypothetical protein